MSHGIGTFLNLVAGVREDGHPSKLVTEERGYTYDQHAYPLLAQFCYIMARRQNDFSWVAPIWEKLVAATHWYETHTIRLGRYFTWQGLMGNGIDNNPAVYGRPPWSSAGVDLATWHYREYRALAKLSCEIGAGCEAEFAEKADRQRQLVQERYWDTVDNNFYNLDMGSDDTQTTRQAITWVTHLKYRSWATLFPLWGKIATPAQAAVLRDRIMSTEEFLAPCGVRSHSAVEPIYNNEPDGESVQLARTGVGIDHVPVRVCVSEIRVPRGGAGGGLSPHPHLCRQYHAEWHDSRILPWRHRAAAH